MKIFLLILILNNGESLMHVDDVFFKPFDKIDTVRVPEEIQANGYKAIIKYAMRKVDDYWKNTTDDITRKCFLIVGSSKLAFKTYLKLTEKCLKNFKGDYYSSIAFKVRHLSYYAVSYEFRFIPEEE